MSSLLDRSAARAPASETLRLPLVPPEIRARYADAIARIPHVRITIRPEHRSAALPTVGSFG
jgi:hypothetical protein